MKKFLIIAMLATTPAQAGYYWSDGGAGYGSRSAPPIYTAPAPTASPAVGWWGRLMMYLFGT